METVLVIDNDEGPRRLVAAHRDEGFKVVEALESKVGIRRAVEEALGIVLSGEDMSLINGVELLPLLKFFTDSPIIEVGSGAAVVPAQVLLQGADIYLTRSASVKEVLAHIHPLLRRHGTGGGSTYGAHLTNVDGFHPW